MKTQTLTEFTEAEPRKGIVSLVVTTSSTPPPRLREKLQHLENLGLPLDDVVLSLAAQAPIDPFGVFGALRALGPWAFQSADCTAMLVLDRQDKEVRSAMKIDLLSDDIAFLAMRGPAFETVKALTGEQISAWLAEDGMTEGLILKRIEACAQAAVAAGRGG